MPLSASELYKAHVLNLRAVYAGISNTERELRSAIARQDDPASDTLLKILLLLTGAWAECRLKKLLYEPAGFDDNARTEILNQRTQFESWLLALEKGFRKQYKVPKVALSNETLTATAWMRYSALRDVILDELRPVIEMRNTLAHGQWSRALNSDGTDISGPMIAAIKRENALSARFKYSLLEAMAMLVHDLVSSPATFERDFDVHFKQITATKINLRKRRYGEWKKSLIDKYQRGQNKRSATHADNQRDEGLLERISSLLFK